MAAKLNMKWDKREEERGGLKICYWRAQKVMP
jgi:hypothetical protein